MKKIRYQLHQQLKHSGAKIMFFLTGIAATVWFLVRVIPKPSRATYPCMKAAAPFMSGFVVYLLSLGGAALIYKRFRTSMARSKWMAAVAFFGVMMVVLLIGNGANSRTSNASQLLTASYFKANQPIGEAKGFAPGRVVWVWDKEATDENFNPSNSATNWWPNFTNADVVQEMLDEAILAYTGEDQLKEGWNLLFKHFNQQKGRGDFAYQPGEKIFVKINVTNSCCSLNGTKKTKDFERMDSTPQLMLALLRHLIETVGVAQEDIYMGDPFRTFHNLYWDVCQTVYPNVIYVDGRGLNGRHKTVVTAEPKMHFSDGQFSYLLPQEYYEADYFINLPCLKSHDTGGITIGAKNHQGSILDPNDPVENQSAMKMHYAFPQHDASEGGSHRYRHLVDYLGHEQLGGNTLLTIVDGIWAGRSWEGYIEPWQMAPFNGDYPNSLFLSQDLVAIDAVCYDFLLEEYKNKPANQQYPYMTGTDDYLLQAADPANWPEGVVYDPENDGTPLKSLGVYEHWNSADSKQYSRNLGTAQGIELVKVFRNAAFNPVINTSNSLLPDNNVKTIYIDSFNVAWFGTPAGLSRYDGVNWTQYNTDNFLSGNEVNDLAAERNTGNRVFWIATNNGLTVATVKSEGITQAETLTEANSDLQGNVVNNVEIDPTNVVWIGTDKAVHAFDGENWFAETSTGDANGDPFTFAQYPISDIGIMEAETMAFITTKGKGIARYTHDPVDGLTGASTFGQPWASMMTDHITSVAFKGEAQWYGTNSGAQYNPVNFTKSDWEIITVEEHELLDNLITAIHVDQNENIWMGTSKGINIMGDDRSLLRYTETDGLISNTIYTITSDPSGNVWVGTDAGIQWFSENPGVNIHTSANKLATQATIKAYPNPASRHLEVELKLEQPGLVRVSVYNMQGQLVDVPLEQKVRETKLHFSLDVSNKAEYPSGIYILKVDAGKSSKVIKLNIQ
ncbi:MAG: DUF362 domain-containing protein [Prolixibacteraceae bacterium]|nr:DUF362 domain-containing protein [Prolixibacteraceae bacterium]